MNTNHSELRELCSRKLLDIYQNTTAAPIKSAIEQVLHERKHFIQQVTYTTSAH